MKRCNNRTTSTGPRKVYTLCVGEGCEMATLCKRFVGNTKSNTVSQTLNYYTTGSGSVSTGNVSITTDCGPMGNWKMFEAVSTSNSPPKTTKV